MDSKYSFQKPPLSKKNKTSRDYLYISPPDVLYKDYQNHQSPKVRNKLSPISKSQKRNRIIKLNPKPDIITPKQPKQLKTNLKILRLYEKIQEFESPKSHKSSASSIVQTNLILKMPFKTPSPKSISPSEYLYTD